jgi:hypothetical protein
VTTPAASTLSPRSSATDDEVTGMPSRQCPGPASGQPPCPDHAIVQATRGAKQAARCSRCQREYNARHNAARRGRRPYDHAERLEHEAIIAAWVERYGWTCPGCIHSGGRPHPSRDLTVDHAAGPVAQGGGRATGGAGKRVVCRRGNSSAGAPIRRGVPPDR